MTSITLYHFWTEREFNARDQLGRWFFWQKSPPYWINAKVEKWEITENLPCEIYTIGGVDRVWTGTFFDVPDRYKNYLHEIRLFFPTPNANDTPTQTMP